MDLKGHNAEKLNVTYRLTLVRIGDQIENSKMAIAASNTDVNKNSERKTVRYQQ